MTETIVTERQEAYIKEVAEEVITQFTNITDSAQKKLDGAYGVRENPMVNAGFDTGVKATQILDKARAANAQSYELLLREPSIARVVVNGKNDVKTTYYICRTSAIHGNNIKSLASYRSPAGRLAALELGDDLELPEVGLVEVIERTRLTPVQVKQGWDSSRSVFEADFGNEIFTIESLRGLLAENRNSVDEEQIDDNLLDLFFADDGKKAHQNISQGIQRSVIEKMGLRDQPILDRIQDEIFRLPINQQLLLLGPPGTGKTTTLIRRLGQKLDIDYLGSTEKRLIESESEHARSWLMFTPTTLLKHYLKEAFAREGVPASDERVVTWEDYRRELGRNALGVLKTTTGRGIYTLKDSLGNLQTSTQSDAILWYEEFEHFQEQNFLQGLLSAAEKIKKSKIKSVRDFSKNALSVLSKTEDTFLILEQLISERNRVQQILENLKTEADQKIRGMANLQLNKDRDFPHQLAAFINEHHTLLEDESDELDESDDEEESENILGAIDAKAALNKYMQVLRFHARSTANKKRINKNTLNAKIIEWLGERSFDEESRLALGANLIEQSHLRRFSNPVSTYINQIPHRYRTFRRAKTQEKRWYIDKTFKAAELHPLELDIILLTYFRIARTFYSKRSVQRNLENVSWAALSTIVDRFKNQILVDEAADFSPIQLACMAALANPKIDSFIACGDFNQRLTTWGARTVEQMAWVAPSIRVEHINITYRQSRQLNELANKLMQMSGEYDKAAELPKNINSEGVAPALLEGASNLDELTDWLALRIVDIEKALNTFPSVAIFVNSEQEVLPLTESLRPKLEDHNLRVVACQQGQSVGQDNDVRVFDIQHIKGLEFEAAFYVGIDELAKYHPELFDKYLYVGVTRAATYLGVTCHDTFPEQLADIKDFFEYDWR